MRDGVGELLEFGVSDRQLRCPLCELPFGLLTIGDIPVVEHYSPYAGIIQLVVGNPFKPAPGAVLVADAGLNRDWVHPGLGEDLGQLVERLLEVVRIDVVGSIGADYLFWT